MFHLFSISSCQCAPKGSAEPPTHKYLDTWLLHNLLIVLPASPSIILFQVEHAIAFQPVHLYYIYTLFTLNISEYVSLLSFLIPVCPHRLSRAIHQHIFSCLASAQLADCITCFTTNYFILVWAHNYLSDNSLLYRHPFVFIFNMSEHVSLLNFIHLPLPYPSVLLQAQQSHPRAQF